MNLPGYSPDFNADEAVWGWAREEATGNLCLGSRAAVQERVDKFLAGLAGRERRGETALPDGPAIKGRNTPARLPPRFPAPGKCTSHLGFGLVKLGTRKQLVSVALSLVQQFTVSPNPPTGCGGAGQTGDER